MKNKLFRFFSVLIILASSLYSQVQQVWVQRYNGPGNSNDTATAIAVDASGNVFITGSSEGSGTGPDYATIKYDVNGVQQWVQRYNGIGNGYDRATSIAVDGSGNVYVTGMSLGNGTGTDYTTIKYNTNGIQQWVQRYHGSGSGNDKASSMVIDGSGNIYITGESNGNGTGLDYATIKYSPNGDSLWVRRYNGPGNGIDYAHAITIDGSGNIYVTGESPGIGTSSDYATIKYNSNGDLLWVQRYDATGNYDAAYAIAVDSSGNVYVTGSSYAPGFHSAYGTVKYNSSGVQQWVKRFNGPLNDFDVGQAIVADMNGNVYVTGSSTEENQVDFDYGTLKYNPSGVEQWARFYDGPGNIIDNGLAIAVDVSGNVYVTGASLGNGTSDDYATVKYNPNGDSLWVIRYDGPASGFDVAVAIVVDASGSVYVTGSSAGIGTGLDFATLKYSQPIGIKQISTEKPDRYLLFQNYPNPFNPVTSIKYQLVKSGFTKLSIFNTLGSEVEVLVKEEQKAGNYEFIWDAATYPSGIYFYQIQTNGFTQTKKMVLLK